MPLANAVLNNPKQLRVRQLLYFGQSEVWSPWVHRFPNVCRTASVCSVAGSAGHAKQALPSRNHRGIVRGYFERRMSCGPVNVPVPDGRRPSFEWTGLWKRADIASEYPIDDYSDDHNCDDAKDQSRPAVMYIRYTVHSKSHQMSKRPESVNG
jgi:hypothetical protein